jgi:hypothetical protein
MLLAEGRRVLYQQRAANSAAENNKLARECDQIVLMLSLLRISQRRWRRRRRRRRRGGGAAALRVPCPLPVS